MGGVRDRLLSRERPVAYYPVRVAPVLDAQDAERALLVARRAAMTVKDDDTQAKAKARRELDRAEKRRDDCYLKLPLRALPPADFEALQDAYPQADSEDEKARRAADEEFLRELFLATVEVDDMTAEDWRTFFRDHLSTGERNELYDTALAINGRARSLDPSVPKG